MDGWQEYLSNGLLLGGVAFALRELVIAVVSVWSMATKNRTRRDHALKLLQMLRVQLRRPPAEGPPTRRKLPGPPL